MQRVDLLARAKGGIRRKKILRRGEADAVKVTALLHEQLNAVIVGETGLRRLRIEREAVIACKNIVVLTQLTILQNRAIQDPRAFVEQTVEKVRILMCLMISAY